MRHVSRRLHANSESALYSRKQRLTGQPPHTSTARRTATGKHEHKSLGEQRAPTHDREKSAPQKPSINSPSGAFTDSPLSCDSSPRYNWLAKFPDADILLGGDFHITLDNVIDRWPIGSCTNTNVKLKMLMQRFDLIDAWRVKHPHTRAFTWCNNSRSKQSRIDLWFPFMGTRTASPRGRYGERPQRDSV